MTPVSQRRLQWRTSWIMGLLAGTYSTLVVSMGAPLIGRAPGVDWMQVGLVLLRDSGAIAEPGFREIAAGLLVHQSADLLWAVVFFGALGHWTRGLGVWMLILLAAPWAVLTSAIEYYLWLPRLQPLLPMQIPYWTALGVHLTSAAVYPLYPYIRKRVIGEGPPSSRAAVRSSLLLGALLITMAAVALARAAGVEPRLPGIRSRSFDLQFITKMAEHHKSGVDMAQTAQERGSNLRLRTIARLIIAQQGSEIELLRQWYRAWMGAGLTQVTSDHDVKGVPTPSQLSDLNSLQGSSFDEAFCALMIRHHQGAISMANEAFDRAGEPRIRLMAASIRHSQEKQIAAMRQLRVCQKKEE